MERRLRAATLVRVTLVTGLQNRLVGSPGLTNSSLMQIAHYRAATPMPVFSLCLQSVVSEVANHHAYPCWSQTVFALYHAKHSDWGEIVRGEEALFLTFRA